ncbi:hypothetical protein [Streptomyces sp. NPDC096132]
MGHPTYDGSGPTTAAARTGDAGRRRLPTGGGQVTGEVRTPR